MPHFLSRGGLPYEVTCVILQRVCVPAGILTANAFARLMEGKEMTIQVVGNAKKLNMVHVNKAFM